MVGGLESGEPSPRPRAVGFGVSRPGNDRMESGGMGSRLAPECAGAVDSLCGGGGRGTKMRPTMSRVGVWREVDVDVGRQLRRPWGRLRLDPRS